MMDTALLMREHPNETVTKATLLQLTEADQCHQMAMRHLDQFKQYNAKVAQQKFLPKTFCKDAHVTERELREAIEIYERSIQMLLKEMVNRPALEFSTLNTKERTQLQAVVARHKHIFEKVKNTHQITGYDEGLSHGLSDGSQNKNKKLKPSLFKALINEGYRRDYFRGYHHGYSQGLRKTERESDLKSRSLQQSNDRER